MHIATHRIPGLVLSDHEFEVPLDHANPGRGSITVFGREVVSSDKESADLPWLTFFQGGPGFGAPRPMGVNGWLGRALQDYRVLLLDERGTGRSTPQTAQSLASLKDAQAQADQLKLFRVDSIVKDAELVRRSLVGDKPWTVLGQSYGGFCCTHYLGAAPEGLAGALFTGGLPGLEATADDVYRRTYPQVISKNAAFYSRYPSDVERVQGIVDHLRAEDIRLPNGERLSSRRFRQLGILLGASDGCESLHYLLEDAWVPGRSELSYSFLRAFENALSYDTNPLYSLLHEACYTQQAASAWSAERIRREHAEFSEDYDGPFHFTGEMIYPWMFDEIRTLQPLKDAAQVLAEYGDWPVVYDRAALAGNTVPCAAAVYAHDMYVDRAYSEDTAAAIPGLKVWLTSEFEHDGLRAAGARVLGRLLDLMHGRA